MIDFANIGNRLGLSRIPRPQISAVTLSLIVSAYILFVLNSGFWDRLFVIYDGQWFQFFTLSLAIFGLTLFTLELAGPWRLQRPVAAVLIVTSAAAAYYEQRFGILIDRELVRAVLETTMGESKHLVTPAMVVAIGLKGVVPAALVFWPRVRRVRLVHHLWRWPLAVGLSFALIAAGVFSDFKAHSATFREQAALMGSYQPGATIVAVVKFARQQLRAAAGPTVIEQVGADAKAGPKLAAAAKPVLLVFFVGETTRAQDFGINGYERQTTPELAKRDIVNFPDTQSCGTSTAVSVPCIFSGLGEAGFSREAFMGRENLADILKRAGFDVKWYDNNTGDQRVMDRMTWEPVDKAWDPAACAEGECTDAIFLPLIEKTAAEMTQNTVLFLHTIGSHGPSYYLRALEARSPFQPECQTSEFADCTTEQIVNGYDNSIVETDFVLSQTIDTLAAQSRVLPAMYYVSDHGESLGENGLYLHAAPLFMAPDTQRKVPHLMWLGDGYQAALGVTHDCIAERAGEAVSHDNIYHTVLGLLDIQTTVRDPALDLTQACRQNGA